jgi:hypothetical protein
LKYLVSQLQNRLPYHIINVDSNDEIYTKDEEFKQEASDIIESLMNQILEDISILESKNDKFYFDELEFFVLICLQTIEIINNYFDDSKYSISVMKKLIGLADKKIEEIKNKKLEKNFSERFKILTKFYNKFEN